MEPDKLKRITVVVTLLGCIYVFGLLVLQLGLAGLVGTGVSLLLIAAAFVLWSRVLS